MGSLLSTELNLQPRIINGRLTLNLHNQGLTSIPEEVFDITDLEVLDVSNNKLTSIPETIGRLQKLSRLDADDNLLTNLPHAIGSLQELTHLCINDNILSTLPPGVEKLQRLTHLFIRSNQLTEFPPGACSLLSLEVLNVHGNKLLTFPPGVEKLQKLRELYVQDNQLTEVPTGVLSLSNLEMLMAMNNRLSTLPSGMCQLYNLREVELWNNKFDTFPEVLCELPAMEILYIGSNSITRLPTALHRADKLKILDVTGNPLTYPPREVREQGASAIMTFLKQEAEEEVLQKLLQAFNRLSVKVKQTQWKPLARSLGFNNSEINDIKASAPDDVPDQVYQTLVQWREKEGEAATLSALEQHLRDLDFQQLADQLSPTRRTTDHRGYETEIGAVGGQEAGNLQSRYPSVTFDRRFPIVEFERLEEQSILGRGGFAYVKKARHLDWRQDVAVKYLLTRKIEGSSGFLPP